MSAFERSAEGSDHLRDLVIELALSGRLGTNEPSDPQAALLVKSAAPMLSDQKRRALADLDPAPFPLPSNWVWTQPQDLGFVSPRNVTSDEEQVGFVPMTVVPVDYRQGLSAETRRWGDIKKAYTHLANGDLAVAKITPCFQNKKSCVIAGLPAGVGAGTTELLVLRPVAGTVDPKYLLLFFKSPLFVLGGIPRMTGTAGQKRVPVEYFASAPLPLPTLPEQQRIVAKVDQLMALCDELEAKQTRKREIGQRLTKAALGMLGCAESQQDLHKAWRQLSGILHVAIAAPTDVNAIQSVLLDLAVLGALGTTSRSEWKRARLDEVTQVVGGVTKGRDLGARKVRSLPYLRVANVQRGYLDLAVMKEIEIAADELGRYSLQRGDVLFTEGGDWDKLGRAAVWTGEIDPCLHQNHVFRARPIQGGPEPGWIALCANSTDGRRYFATAAKQTTNLASINMTQLRAFPLLLPSVEEQRRILARVEQLQSLCQDLKAKLRIREETAAKLAEALVTQSTGPSEQARPIP